MGAIIAMVTVWHEKFNLQKLFKTQKNETFSLRIEQGCNLSISLLDSIRYDHRFVKIDAKSKYLCKHRIKAS